MDPGKTSIRFQDTRWSLVDKARQSRGDLDRLMVTYWSPVYGYLRRHGQSPDDAADLTQGFLTEVVLGRDLLDRADPARGRFRALLLTALKRFVIDEHRRECGRGAKRPRTNVAKDLAALDRVEPGAEDPAEAFEQEWRRAVLERALQRVRRGCARKGMELHWSVFDARVVRPALYGGEPASIAELQRLHGLTNAQDVSTLLQTVKRKVERALRDVLSESGDVAAEVERDWQDLMSSLEP